MRERERERAYWYFNGQWKHVYIIERFQQSDIFGEVVEMCRIKLKKHTNEVYEVEAEKLQPSKPRRRRESV